MSEEVVNETRRGFEELRKDLTELRRDLADPLEAAREADRNRASMYASIKGFVDSKAGTLVITAFGLVTALSLAQAFAVLDPFVGLIARLLPAAAVCP